MCASPCGFVRGVCAWRPAASAVLSRRFARRASGLTALSRLFASVHACLFSFVRKKETACGILRSCSAGSRSPFVRSRDVGAVICLCGFTSGLAVSLWRSRRGCRGHEERGMVHGRTGLAARALYIFARAHWPSNDFRREYAGAARPRLRQRVFDSLDSLHVIRHKVPLAKPRNKRHPRTAAPTPRKTRVHGKT